MVILQQLVLEYSAQTVCLRHAIQYTVTVVESATDFGDCYRLGCFESVSRVDVYDAVHVCDNDSYEANNVDDVFVKGQRRVECHSEQLDGISKLYTTPMTWTRCMLLTCDNH